MAGVVASACREHKSGDKQLQWVQPLIDDKEMV